MSMKGWESKPEDGSSGRVESVGHSAGSDESLASLEPFVLEVSDVLDLHMFAPRDVKDVVEAYLEEARAKGFRQVRIIHGKGIGVQREMVRAILARTDFVTHFEQAPAEAGSWGATLAYLTAP